MRQAASRRLYAGIYSYRNDATSRRRTKRRFSPFQNEVTFRRRIRRWRCRDFLVIRDFKRTRMKQLLVDCRLDIHITTRQLLVYEGVFVLLYRFHFQSAFRIFPAICAKLSKSKCSVYHSFTWMITFSSVSFDNTKTYVSYRLRFPLYFYTNSRINIIKRINRFSQRIIV